MCVPFVAVIIDTLGLLSVPVGCIPMQWPSTCGVFGEGQVCTHLWHIRAQERKITLERWKAKGLKEKRKVNVSEGSSQEVALAGQGTSGWLHQ